LSRPCRTERDQIRAPSPAPVSEWLHIAAAIDTLFPVARLYVDGDMVSETTTLANGTAIPPEPLRNTTESTKIGGLPPHANNYTDGAVDELRIWDVARSQEEIWSAMYRRLRGDEPGLVDLAPENGSFRELWFQLESLKDKQ
ncbi:MAG: LamG domain-containing protein, partial [Planctomycetes bacterium]|nr:LamG domain-containing protein [Planctomycetota bacterium]